MKSRISKSRHTLIFLLPTLITIGWITATLKGLPAVVAALGGIFVLLSWYGYLTIPYEFELKTENSIQFSAVLRKITVQVSDVREINARPWNRGMVTFRLPHGPIYLFRGMPKLKDLIDKVKDGNPSVQVRGNP